MRIMQERMIVFQKAFAGPVKQNWQKMGLAFKTLQASFENDDNPSESDWQGKIFFKMMNLKFRQDLNSFEVPVSR